MGKTAFLFAGQGAQKVGMGKELCEKFPCADRIFDIATENLGYDMKQMVFDGDDQTLMITENTQPAILTMSIACLEVLKEKGIKADVVAGLSLGEYSAHVAAGTMKFEDAVKLVKKRGKYMQETVPVGVGGMAVILSLDADTVRDICKQASSEGIVEPANFNCPGQITVAGEIKAVEKACELAKEAGAKRAMLLPVSAPFHCSMLKPAGEMLGKELENIEISDFNIPLVTNVTADYVEKKEDIKELLVRQVSGSVLFEDSIRKMLADGVDTFIEVGPGNILSGFVKKIDKEVKTLNIENVESLENILASI